MSKETLSYEELLKEDKETLARLVVKLQQIRKSQARRLESQEREIDKYEDQFMEMILKELPD